jgi:DNA invertase Pin-like site-specific DNA recombinase
MRDIAAARANLAGCLLHLYAAFAQLERRRISQRTREALGVLKARGALLGNRKNPQRARELGKVAVREKAERFACSMAPIIAGIVASGIVGDAGSAEALNLRRVATARGAFRQRRHGLKRTGSVWPKCKFKIFVSNPRA